MRSVANSAIVRGLLLAALLLQPACSMLAPQGPTSQEGVASWYGPGFEGRQTASGEIYDPMDWTAAHPTLPMHTKVQVTRLDNSRRVTVRINDRGPYAKDRIIDLSKRAAMELDMVGPGTAPVRVDILDAQAVSFQDLSYSVQVGSFQDPDAAGRLRRRLYGRYQEVRIVFAHHEGKAYYRVRVGRFPRRQAAEQLAASMAQEGIDAVVVEALP